jgi:hypothetical protein
MTDEEKIKSDIEVMWLQFSELLKTNPETELLMSVSPELYSIIKKTFCTGVTYGISYGMDITKEMLIVAREKQQVK